MCQGYGFGLDCIQALSSLDSFYPFCITFSRQHLFMDYMYEFFHVESSEYLFPKSIYIQAHCTKTK